MNKPPTQKRRIIERRKHPRIFTPSGALVSFKRLLEPIEIDEHTEGEGTLTELSREGYRLLSDIPLNIGERYHLILQVSKKSCPIIIEAALVRWTRENAYGLKFTSMQSIQESHFRELLLELHRPAPYRSIEMRTCHVTEAGQRSGPQTARPRMSQMRMYFVKRF